MQLSIVTGPQVGSDNVTGPLRGGKTGEAMVSELQGRFYENCYRNALFSSGLANVSISNASFTIADVASASMTPILGLINPLGSQVNLVLLQAVLSVAVTATTATGPGVLGWYSCLNQTALSVAQNVPLNAKTLQQGGSGRGLSNIAMTGLVVANPFTFLRASALSGGVALGTTSTVANLFNGGDNVENFDGGLILPPNAAIALLASVTPVAHTVSGHLLWAEVAL